jgi:hypothetical protein
MIYVVSSSNKWMTLFKQSIHEVADYIVKPINPEKYTTSKFLL